MSGTQLWIARSAVAVFPRATGKHSALAADRSSQDGPRPLQFLLMRDIVVLTGRVRAIGHGQQSGSPAIL